jgi:serine/threonine-protein kinase HipA
VLFSVLITNTDDHLKNHGFIYAGDGLWRLSPLFDVNPQPERHRLLKTAIIDGAPFDASLSLVLEAAEYFDLTATEAARRARTMAERISGTWKDEVRRQGLNNAELRALTPAFEHTEMDEALSL